MRPAARYASSYSPPPRIPPFAARLLYMGFKSGIWNPPSETAARCAWSAEGYGVRQLAAAFFRRACSADSTTWGPTSSTLAVEKRQQAAALQSFAIGNFRGRRREAQGRQEPG